MSTTTNPRPNAVADPTKQLTKAHVNAALAAIGATQADLARHCKVTRSRIAQVLNYAEITPLWQDRFRASLTALAASRGASLAPYIAKAETTE